MKRAASIQPAAHLVTVLTARAFRFTARGRSGPAATGRRIYRLDQTRDADDFDWRRAAREYLSQASALIRAQSPPACQQRPKQSGLIAWQIKRVIAYVEAHRSERIVTRALAKEVNLSVSHFFRAFRTSVGITPRDYIVRKRVELAQELMLTTRDSLCQIATDCGLSDQSHLCRVFRRVVGQSPNAWRRAHAFEPAMATTAGVTNKAHRDFTNAPTEGSRSHP